MCCQDFRKGIAKAGEDIVFKKFPMKGSLIRTLRFCESLARFGEFVPSKISNRELQQLVQNTLNSDSPFHMSHAESFTDATVYPAPGEIPSNGSAPKKRKREGEASTNDAILPHNDTQHAKIPCLMVCNQHLSQKVHVVVKRECAEMAGMILALKEHDEKQLYIARQHVLDLRNMYAVLTDLMQKNISKIRAPKANNSAGLY
ncbi:hypothetical protein H0H93_014185 [Arthromyces matolae]|nr:hypothetical protein H0H93_014185 [Arthromyces matolae]